MNADSKPDEESDFDSANTPPPVPEPVDVRFDHSGGIGVRCDCGRVSTFYTCQTGQRLSCPNCGRLFDVPRQPNVSAPECVRPEPTKPKNQEGLAIGLAIIAGLAGPPALFVVGLAAGWSVSSRLVITLLGVYVMYWGLLFGSSYFYSHKCFVLRGLSWWGLIRFWWWPRTVRGMIFIPAGTCIFFGLYLILVGLGLIRFGPGGP